MNPEIPYLPVTLAHQFAVEFHVILAADHDHLGGRVANFREPVEFRQRFLAAQLGFDHQQVGRDLAVIVLDGGVDGEYRTLCTSSQNPGAPKSNKVSARSTDA